MRNDKYWTTRMEAVEKNKIRNTALIMVELEKQYRLAESELDIKIASWYQRFADNNRIDLVSAKKLLQGKELQEFRWTVEEYIKKGRTLNYTDR